MPDWMVGLAIAIGSSFVFLLVVAVVLPRYRTRVYRKPLPDVWRTPEPSEWRSKHQQEAQVFRSVKAVNQLHERRVLRADFTRNR